MCDIYSFDINFKVDKNAEKINNSFGGIMSIIFICLTMSYLSQQVVIMYQMAQTSFQKSSSWREATKQDPIVLGKFNDTFNMLVGISNKTFNWFDNPYIAVNVVDID